MNINYNWYLKILPSSSYNNLGGSAARKGDGIHHKVLWVISITLFELSFGGSPGYAMIGDGPMTYSCEMGRWRESRATYSCPVARGIIYAYTPCMCPRPPVTLPPNPHLIPPFGTTPALLGREFSAVRPQSESPPDLNLANQNSRRRGLSDRRLKESHFLLFCFFDEYQ